MHLLPATQDLVLLGGGHSHALALRMLAMQPPAQTRITLISPDTLTPYSGMLPGLLAGHYSLEETHIDLARLCQWAGARFVRGRACQLDPHRQRLTLSDGSALDYDVLSIDIGSTPALQQVPGAAEYAIAVKPVADFRQRWQHWLDRAQAGSRIAVVGGGAGGSEIILALATALARRNLPADLHLICASTLLNGYPRRLQRLLRTHLRQRRITLHEHSRISKVDAGVLHTEQGTQPFDVLFWCTGASGADWLQQTPLALDNSGFIRCRATLQSVNFDTVFAAGDCAAVAPWSVPKAGVYAVRQAPVLAANLRAACLGQALKPWRPQRRFLSLLALGDGTALGSRGPLTLSGSWVWRWKDRIDRRFMAQFAELSPRRMKPASAAPPERCNGCGAKVGSTTLHAALNDLQPLANDAVLAGLKQPDDASLVRWPADRLLVQSQDYFPAFVDDPDLFARICVQHCLSDLYAMNAQPHSALATIALPAHQANLQGRDLRRLMQAAVSELNQAGCTLLGGHTLEGPQLAAGFTVNGSAEESTLWRKAGARAGDHLLLTKPLGTGVILAGLMPLLTPARSLDAALQSMLQSNGPAAQILARHDTSAVTDITGFGLLGHLLEMLLPGGLTARLDTAAIPVLAGAISLVQRGVHSTLKIANDQVLQHCRIGSRWQQQPLLTLLTDPQTSGGLLAAVAPTSLDACLAALAAAGIEAAAIGTISQPGEPGGSPDIELR